MSATPTANSTRHVWPAPQTRPPRAPNLRGAATLLRREAIRSLRVWDFTVVSATIRAVLFTAVFSVATSGVDRSMGGMPLLDFLIPGLIAAAVLEHAFVSAAFSLVHDRIEGIIGDIVVVPMSLLEVLVAYVINALVGALVIGALVWVVLLPFGAPMPHDLPVLLGFAAGGAVLVGFLSAIIGLRVRRWDSLAAVQTFVVLPFVFTSGVFFSLDRLPGVLAQAARANPLLYVVDGMRYGLTGSAETDLAVGGGVIALTTLVLGGLCAVLFARGYGLRD